MSIVVKITSIYARLPFKSGKIGDTRLVFVVDVDSVVEVVVEAVQNVAVVVSAGAPLSVSLLLFPSIIVVVHLFSSYCNTNRL